MNIGIVISQVEPETVWNAFRFANFSIDKGHKVNTFLMGKGVECVDIKSEEYRGCKTSVCGFHEGYSKKNVDVVAS